jgi:hypothetical protein
MKACLSTRASYSRRLSVVIDGIQWKAEEAARFSFYIDLIAMALRSLTLLPATVRVMSRALDLLCDPYVRVAAGGPPGRVGEGIGGSPSRRRVAAPNLFEHSHSLWRSDRPDDARSRH